MTIRKREFQYESRKTLRVNEYRFFQAIEMAYRRDVTSLCELIRKGHPQFPENRESLAQVIEHLVPMTKRERRRPPIVRRTAREEAHIFIAKQVRKKKEQEKKKAGFKRISRPLENQMIDKAIEAFRAAEMHMDPRVPGAINIDKDEVRKRARDTAFWKKEELKAKSVKQSQ